MSLFDNLGLEPRLQRAPRENRRPAGFRAWRVPVRRPAPLPCHSTLNPPPATFRRAFSLLEMMVVVALLTMIVLGLYTVFEQTQRALRSNNAQVDVMEAGRATMDLLTREIEQAAAPGLGTNHFSYQPSHPTNQIDPYYLPLRLNDGTIRTNVVMELKFLSRSNNWWVGSSYFVSAISNNALHSEIVSDIGVGTLYRCIPTNAMVSSIRDTNQLYGLLAGIEWSRNNLTNLFPLVDGVVHFRVRALDTQGWPITNANSGLMREDLRDYWLNLNSNKLPAFVDLELGLLAPQVLQRVRAIPNPGAQRNYLTNQAGAVQLFHRMIRLRNDQNER